MAAAPAADFSGCKYPPVAEIKTTFKPKVDPRRNPYCRKFENPRGGEALTVSGRLFPKNSKTVLQSPPVECVRRDRPYTVTIRLRAPDGHVMQTLETKVTSDTGQSLLPAKPLVVGPLYTPNPDVFHSEGTMAMKPVQDCPAS